VEERIAVLEALVRILQVQLAGEQAARLAADQALQTAIAMQAAAHTAGDLTLQTALNTEAAARIGGDQTLQMALNTEAAARTGGEQTLQTAIDAAVAANTVTETFTSRVPASLDDLSLAHGVQVQYTDMVFGQNTHTGVFSMQPNGTITILKAGSIGISASLGIQVNTGSVASSDAGLSIEINGFPRASSFANIGSAGGDTLHVTLNWKVQAGDVITLRASSSNNIHPATLVCCNDSTLSVRWIGIK